MISFADIAKAKEVAGEVTQLLRSRGVEPLRAVVVLGICAFGQLEASGWIKIDRARVLATLARLGSDAG